MIVGIRTGNNCHWVCVIARGVREYFHHFPHKWDSVGCCNIDHIKPNSSGISFVCNSHFICKSFSYFCTKHTRTIPTLCETFQNNHGLLKHTSYYNIPSWFPLVDWKQNIWPYQQIGHARVWLICHTLKMLYNQNNQTHIHCTCLKPVNRSNWKVLLK